MASCVAAAAGGLTTPSNGHPRDARAPRRWPREGLVPGHKPRRRAARIGRINGLLRRPRDGGRGKAGHPLLISRGSGSLGAQHTREAGSVLEDLGPARADRRREQAGGIAVHPVNCLPHSRAVALRSTRCCRGREVAGRRWCPWPWRACMAMPTHGRIVMGKIPGQVSGSRRSIPAHRGGKRRCSGRCTARVPSEASPPTGVPRWRGCR